MWIFLNITTKPPIKLHYYTNFTSSYGLSLVVKIVVKFGKNVGIFSNEK